MTGENPSINESFRLLSRKLTTLFCHSYVCYIVTPTYALLSLPRMHYCHSHEGGSPRSLLISRLFQGCMTKLLASTLNARLKLLNKIDFVLVPALNTNHFT